MLRRLSKWHSRLDRNGPYYTVRVRVQVELQHEAEERAGVPDHAEVACTVAEHERAKLVTEELGVRALRGCKEVCGRVVLHNGDPEGVGGAEASHGGWQGGLEIARVGLECMHLPWEDCA